MSSEAVKALLQCHFGGPDDRGQAHIAARVDLYGLPPLDVAIEQWILPGVVLAQPLVAVALVDPQGLLLLESGPGTIFAADLALPVAHHDPDLLPETAAGQIASRLAGDFWDLRPLAQLKVPLALAVPRHGTTGLLYMARTVRPHPRGAGVVPLASVPLAAASRSGNEAALLRLRCPTA